MDGSWKIVLGELDIKMGVTIIEESAERVVATLPVEGNRQSFGLLHGGASVAFAEALGSWAAVIHAGPGRSAVGLDINATHHLAARSGIVSQGLARRTSEPAKTTDRASSRRPCRARTSPA